MIVGKDLLQMLMFSIYPEPETIYREYLQNASDAIREAINQKIISQDEGHISISVKEFEREIVISDNGTGISANSAEAVLKNIAVSPKKGNENQAGFYGIGRLVGAGYCEKLIFETSAYGEDLKSILEFDVNEIREILDDSRQEISVEEVVETVTLFSQRSVSREEHYFKVTLEGVLPYYSKSLLVEENIKNYLMQVAPIDFKDQFKVQLFDKYAQENKMTKYTDNINCVKISLNENYNIQKKYSWKIDGTGDEIIALRFEILHDPKYGILAWLWYAVTPFDTQIPDIDEVTKSKVLTRGLRLRIKNIQIGSEKFFDGTEYFKQARSNKYFNGEVHVVHENIKPTTDRSNLAPSPETIALQNALRDFCNNEMQKNYQDANKLKASWKKFEDINVEKQKIINTPISKDFSKEDKDLKLENVNLKLNKVIEDLNDKLNKPIKNEGERILKKHFIQKLREEKSESPRVPKAPLAATNTLSNEEDPCDVLLKKYSKEEVRMVKRIFGIIEAKFHKESYQQYAKMMKKEVLKVLLKDN